MKYVKTRARLFENNKPLQENDWILTKDVFDYEGQIVSNSKKDGYEVYQAHTVRADSVTIWVEYLPEYGYANVDFSNQSKPKCSIVQFKGQRTLKEDKAKKYGIPIYTYKEAKVKVKEMAENFAKYNL